METLSERIFSTNKKERGSHVLVQTIIFAIAFAISNVSEVNADTIKFIPQEPLCGGRETESCESVTYDIVEDDVRQICKIGIVCKHSQPPLVVS